MNYHEQQLLKTIYEQEQLIQQLRRELAVARNEVTQAINERNTVRNVLVATEHQLFRAQKAVEAAFDRGVAHQRTLEAKALTARFRGLPESAQDLRLQAALIEYSKTDGQ